MWEEFKLDRKCSHADAELQSFGDHRIAMAFAIAALRAEGETVIRGSESAAISYPAFFSALEEITER